MRLTNPKTLLLLLSTISATASAQNRTSSTAVSASRSASPSAEASPEPTAGFFTYLFIGYPDCSVDCLTSAYTNARCPSDASGNCPCQSSTFLSQAGACSRNKCNDTEAEEVLELQKKKCARNEFDEKTWMEGAQPSSIGENKPDGKSGMAGTETPDAKGGTSARFVAHGMLGAGLSAVLAVAFGSL